ncbi:hypothetical protein BDV28DRAFT_155005 [Aspergillus coremiiformis]|uniref:DUF1996 domain-containing protein n=1 Tax=Aspergillus coremiiformis TaxID=138285 RepID=A0A5N6ZDY9_9EURO|nr:hypothetical protein BDV28DRAFT_155005 [Aspergillus coremiiformis]
MATILSLALFGHSVSSSSHTMNEIFTFSCLPLTTQRSDPIVSPGKPSSHTHVVTGGTAFQRQMTTETAKNANQTTCGIEIDRSNYWIPQLYHQTQDGLFETIEYESSAIYYLNRACDYSPNVTSCDGTRYPLAPPAGLRVVAGDLFLRTYNDTDFAQRAISHMCINEDGTSSETKHLPQKPCLKLRSQVFFPSCWDGKTLDSPDHRSHMAYPAIGDYNLGVCPQTHPVAVYSIFLEFFFNTEPFPDHQNWVYAMGDPTGYGLHGDFLNGWLDQDALQNAMETCTGPEGLSDPECSITKAQKRTLAPIAYPLDVPPPTEKLGQHGPLHTLPGDNPVTGPRET